MSAGADANEEGQLKTRTFKLESMNQEQAAEYELTQSHWLKIDWTGRAEHTYLLRLFVRRDLISKYKQTVLGLSWWVAQRLSLALVLRLYSVA